MNLVSIKDYEELYSFDLNNNLVYSHFSNKYLKPILNKINGYYQINFNKNGKSQTIRLHRLIYEYNIGEIPTRYCIDHIDGNRQNNHIDNLRLATISQNTCNQKKRKDNNTGFKNIKLRKNNTYQVRIQKNKKYVYNKTFKTLEEAIENRDIQLVLIHGEFHNLG